MDDGGDPVRPVSTRMLVLVFFVHNRETHCCCRGRFVAGSRGYFISRRQLGQQFVGDI